MQCVNKFNKLNIVRSHAKTIHFKEEAISLFLLCAFNGLSIEMCHVT